MQFDDHNEMLVKALAMAQTAAPWIIVLADNSTGYTFNTDAETQEGSYPIPKDQEGYKDFQELEGRLGWLQDTPKGQDAMQLATRHCLGLYPDAEQSEKHAFVYRRQIFPEVARILPGMEVTEENPEPLHKGKEWLLEAQGLKGRKQVTEWIAALESHPYTTVRTYNCDFGEFFHVPNWDRRTMETRLCDGFTVSGLQSLGSKVKEDIWARLRLEFPEIAPVRSTHVRSSELLSRRPPSRGGRRV